MIIKGIEDLNNTANKFDGEIYYIPLYPPIRK